MERRIDIDDGKYTVFFDEEKSLIKCGSVLRHGAPWRDVCGDKFINALVARIVELEDLLKGRRDDRPETQRGLQAIEETMREIRNRPETKRGLQAIDEMMRAIRERERAEILGEKEAR